MSLCPHGYTAFWDCPTCEEPMGTNTAVRADDIAPDAPEDVCRGCGKPHVSHMRTERDAYCGECQNPEER